MSELVIHTDKLTKRFGDFVAVDALSLSISGGEIFGFLGANGAGKTTAHGWEANAILSLPKAITPKAYTPEDYMRSADVYERYPRERKATLEDFGIYADKKKSRR